MSKASATRDQGRFVLSGRRRGGGRGSKRSNCRARASVRSTLEASRLQCARPSHTGSVALDAPPRRPPWIASWVVGLRSASLAGTRPAQPRARRLFWRSKVPPTRQRSSWFNRLELRPPTRVRLTPSLDASPGAAAVSQGQFRPRRSTVSPVHLDPAVLIEQGPLRRIHLAAAAKNL